MSLAAVMAVAAMIEETEVTEVKQQSARLCELCTLGNRSGAAARQSPMVSPRQSCRHDEDRV